MMNVPTLDQTRDWVRELFAGVTDKAGKPYADHCERVERSLGPEATEDERHAALLHDVLEDTMVTSAELIARGYSSRTVILVERLTRTPADGTYMDYVRGIAATGDRGLIRIKLADNADNSSPERIASLPPEQRDILRRYERARKVLTA